MHASHYLSLLVMPGLDPGIYAALDCRVKPGNDGWERPSRWWSADG
jgi:hypothetical protein